MDSLLELPYKLATALMALALILMALKGPPSGGASQRVAHQLSFPFMVSQMAQKQRGHPLLRKAAKRYINLASGENVQ